MNNNYLEHHGIKGMKWYERRFQNEDGSLTPAGRERYGVGKPREASVAVRMKNGLKRAGSAVVNTTKAKVKAYVDAAPERREKKKQKILQSGDASLILKNKKKFSNQELQEGLNRARSIDAVRQETNVQAFARIEGVVNKFAKIANTGLTAVNTVENIRNGIDKIKSWGEEKDFVGKTPEELLSNAKNLSSTGAKKLAERLNSIVSANKSVNDINTAGIKSELDKYKTLEELRKARETYTKNLNKKKDDSEFDVDTMSLEDLRKNFGKLNPEQAAKAAKRIKTWDDADKGIDAIEGRAKKRGEKDKEKTKQEKPEESKNPEDSTSKPKSVESQSSDNKSADNNSEETKTFKRSNAKANLSEAASNKNETSYKHNETKYYNYNGKKVVEIDANEYKRLKAAGWNPWSVTDWTETSSREKEIERGAKAIKDTWSKINSKPIDEYINKLTQQTKTKSQIKKAQAEAAFKESIGRHDHSQNLDKSQTYFYDDPDTGEEYAIEWSKDEKRWVNYGYSK